MRKDYYSYAKLELLDTARVQVACNENLALAKRVGIVKDIDEEYIQTINEAEGQEFKAAQDMIGDISSSYASREATNIIMEKLFNRNYEFQDQIFEFAETSEFIDAFHGAISYHKAENLTFDDVHDEISKKAKEIATLANETDFSM